MVGDGSINVYKEAIAIREANLEQMIGRLAQLQKAIEQITESLNEDKQRLARLLEEENHNKEGGVHDKRNNTS